MDRHTKIVATLGPAVASADRIRALVDAGIDVARLNFSHMDHAFHGQMADWVRAAAKATGRNVALLQDVQGPKLRVGTLDDGPLTLSVGAEVGLVASDHAGGSDIPIDYPPLLEEIETGEEVVLADGMLRLAVTGRDNGRLLARVVVGGTLLPRKGVAFPNSALQVDAVTVKDVNDLAFGREIGVDYVAVSFVRRGEEIERARSLSGDAPIIAKVELAAAYDNLDEIIATADGVMVARGDLGVQMPLEQIPHVQNDILTRANRAGLLTITATEMLESMTHSPRPTRAEVTDVATAVLEGTDAVMLSGETASGDYPVEAVEAMARICSTAEASAAPDTRRSLLEVAGQEVASAMAHAAVEAAAELEIETIVAFTESGSTARLLSKYRPGGRIVAFTAVPSTRRRMALYWGVTAHEFERRDFTDHMFAAAEKSLEKDGVCQKGDLVVMVAGIPPNQRASTNLVKVHEIGERQHGVPSQKGAKRT
ncbi:MAG TPA: pyruvate kinase [Acidimicrobiia bacterium]|jgi:pyruvate kinase